MRKTACVLMVFFFAALASAQIPTSGNIFVGYSFENTNWSGLNSLLGRPNLHGWNASLEGKVFPHLGIVTDFSAHYGSEHFTVPPGGPTTVNVTGHEWEILFGPRLSIPVGNVTPFGEAMFGVAHIGNSSVFTSNTTNTSFATALGGGLDYRLVKFVALRLEADYLRTRFYSTGQNAVRLSTGVVFRF